ncbi:hypothetical protein Bbelb_012310 [Branchiostoma belcheri]|nr:hypothetical protein Bbelb_012310 [Branchiostoma belcheri]
MASLRWEIALARRTSVRPLRDIPYGHTSHSRLTRITAHGVPVSSSDALSQHYRKTWVLRVNLYWRLAHLVGEIATYPDGSSHQSPSTEGAALNIAFSKKLTPRRGRPRGGLLDCLVDDVKLYFHQNVQTAPYMYMLKWLREQAADKARWNGTFKTIDVTH